MKKLACFLLAWMAILPLAAAHEVPHEAAPVDSTSIKGYHPYDEEQNLIVSRNNANWSLIPHVGFNVFDGDFNSEMVHPIGYPSAGLDIEYDFTPVFGLGVEYMFTRYGVAGKQPAEAKTLLSGQLHKASGYLSVDLIGLFYPHDKRKIFGLNAMVGGGYGFYKTSIMYKDDFNSTKNINTTHTGKNTSAYINANGDPAGTPDKMTKFDGSPFLKFALNFEFNINRTLAIGIRGGYDYFFTDHIDGRGYAGDKGLESKKNDGTLDVTLNLRIKIAGKNNSHVRNMGGNDPSVEIARRLAALENNANALGGRDTLVVVNRDTIVMASAAAPAEQPVQANASYAPSNYYVYYPTNKASISDAGLAAIQQVADRMKGDASLYAVITGYCDNTGPDKFNNRLGDKRAENVADELIEEYDIPADHVYAGGAGKLVGKRSNAAYSPNRRAVIQLVDEETFRVLSAELENLRAKRPENIQKAPKSPAPVAKEQPKAAPVAKEQPKAAHVAKEQPKATPKEQPEAAPKEEAKPAPEAETQAPAKPAPVPAPAAVAAVKESNPYAMRDGEDIVADKNTSLAQLAREYYDNTFCWIYIFLANEEIINPNQLVTGSKLHIPELTEEEMATSREVCSQMYQAAKRLK